MQAAGHRKSGSRTPSSVPSGSNHFLRPGGVWPLGWGCEHKGRPSMVTRVAEGCGCHVLPCNFMWRITWSSQNFDWLHASGSFSPRMVQNEHVLASSQRGGADPLVRVPLLSHDAPGHKRGAHILKARRVPFLLSKKSHRK